MAAAFPQDVLQNQDRFADPAYRARVAPLVEVIRRRSRLAPALWLALRRSPWLSGLLLFVHARGFRVVVTVGHRPALVFGFLRRLLGRRDVLHVAKEFYFDETADRPRPGWHGLVQRLRLRLYHFALRDLAALVVNARGECPAYARLFGLAAGQVTFLPWPSNIDDPEWVKDNDGSILAAGRSLRDWPTFFRAVDGLPHRFVVVGSAADLAGLAVPANVAVHADVPRARYLDLLRRSLFAVVPLVETQRSTGQATFLECLALGKPVVVSAVTGSVDYLEHGVSGLLYPPGDAGALREQIVRLAGDFALRERLARGGLRAVRERFNKARHARDLLDLIDRLLGRRAEERSAA